MSITEIRHAASSLSQEERGALAAWLLDSLPPHGGEDAMVEGVEEADRRRKELDAGETQGVSSDAFWDSINRERAEWG